MFARLGGRPDCLFLDSASRHPTLGRYSFVAADPFDFLRLPADGSDALACWPHGWPSLPATPVAGLPPFQGGAAGLFGYDLGRSLERCPPAAIDEFQVPALAMGLYDVVVAFDHAAGRAWIISQGLPEVEPGRRTRRAARAARAVQDWIAERLRRRASVGEHGRCPRMRCGDLESGYRLTEPGARQGTAADELAPQYAVPGVPRRDQQLLRATATCARSSGRSTTSTPATSSR